MADRPDRPDIDYLGQHREFFGDVTPTNRSRIEKGQVVRFIYNGIERTIFVVAANWENKLHGLDLKHVPRRVFLRAVNAPLTLSEQQLYDKVLDKPIFRELQAYRTFDRRKINSLRNVFYNSILQPDERGEPDIQEPEQLNEG